MRWMSALSTAPSLEAAVREVTTVIARELDGARADLAVAFVSEQHQREYERVPALVRGHLAPRFMLGCSAGGVIGGGHEIEREAGVSLTVATLPDVELTAFHL
jgi:small ligand-binding sensory domain FIST